MGTATNLEPLCDLDSTLYLGVASYAMEEYRTGDIQIRISSGELAFG